MLKFFQIFGNLIPSSKHFEKMATPCFQKQHYQFVQMTIIQQGRKTPMFGVRLSLDLLQKLVDKQTIWYADAHLGDKHIT